MSSENKREPNRNRKWQGRRLSTSRVNKQDASSSRTGSLARPTDHPARRSHSQQKLTADVNHNQTQDGNGDSNESVEYSQNHNRKGREKSKNVLANENKFGRKNNNKCGKINEHENVQDGQNHHGSKRNGVYDQISHQKHRNQNVNDKKSNFGTKNKPTCGMDISKLRTLTKEIPSKIILILVDKRSGFRELVNQEHVPDNVVILLVKLLSTAVTSNLHKENLNHLMTILLTSRLFTQHLPTLISKNGRKPNFDVELFSNVGKICYIITHQMPSSAFEDLQLCVDACETSMSMRAQMKLPVPVEAMDFINDTQKAFLELAEKQKQMSEQQSVMNQFPDLDYEFEDFRQINIIPSIGEMMNDKNPLLHRNVTQGQYKDVNHYLDTHFRLLREDFVQPLRKGISEYIIRQSKKNLNPNAKINDIRVYENVHIQGRKFGRNGLCHLIKLGNFTTNKKLRFDMSKSLIYGSLVCLSADKFETVLFATVLDSFGRSKDMKCGQLTVTFEDDFETQCNLTADSLHLTYTMVESQAYFEAYKYILLGLQNTTAETLPLQNYIIKAQPNLEPPTYIDSETTYDMSCIVLSTSATESQEEQKLPPDEKYLRRNCFLRRKNSSLKPQPLHIQVQNLNTWPSTTELCMDDSQRKALHLALSSAMAIIQGPPGTGKTYVGLKIAQVLLHNSNIWRTEKRDTGPILVVCYTNHALDQFLEGMLSFTKRLVRVGSRSQNESLAKFNIRNIRLQGRRFYNFGNKDELREIRGKWEEVNQRAQLLKMKIVHEESLHILKEFGEAFLNRLVLDFQCYILTDAERQMYMSGDFINIPEYFSEQQVWYPSSFLFTWLGLDLNGWVDEMEVENFFYEGMEGFEILINTSKKPSHAQSVNFESHDFIIDEVNLEEFINVEDVRNVEENRRILDTEIDEDLSPIHCKTESMVWAFDVNSLHDPSEQISLEGVDPVTWEKAHILAEIRKSIAIRELKKHDIMDETELEMEMQSNLWTMSLQNRWRLYRLIIQEFIKSAEIEKEALQQVYNTTAKRMKEVEDGEILEILAENDVIGMTTTGAAKYHEVLQALNPTIVIVEEAAEVLESHIVTSLAPKTQHLILIGDHQQLRPKSTVYTLCKNYHLDVSLFERMINNGVCYETLKIQHRMRPEISRLLVPLIYDCLEDHPSVKEYPVVKGTACSLYFINHSVKEDVVDNTKTHSNKFEAEYLVSLCRYLLQQGYSPDKITILTAYVGQLYTFRNLMKKKIFQGVRVSSIDNFQGEENDIILLSFVRSNDNGIIGFLNISNRVNVALSRARHGMFCIGNFRLFATKCDLWRRLMSSLECQDFIGDGVEIVCQKHSDSHQIKKSDGFRKVAPNGGCLKICNEVLPCKHICKDVCHLSEHKCLEPCSRITCGLGHLCPLPCYKECEPCKVPVVKPFLTCEHFVRIPCYKDVSTVLCTTILETFLPDCEHMVLLPCSIDPDEYKCEATVHRELPHCKHLISMYCHQDPNEVVCPKPCEWLFKNCGHQCSKTCHPLDDPEHLNIRCEKPCTKLICDRNHKCSMLCHEECNKCIQSVMKDLPCGHQSIMLCLSEPGLYTCIAKCNRMLPCGHECSNKCSVTCGGCNILIEKQLPQCLHKMLVPCSANLELVRCTKSCDLRLPCGHTCQGKCSEPCTTSCKVDICLPANCGHDVKVPCYAKNVSPDILSYNCNYPCKKILPNCQHVCKGTCKQCRQGRVHIPCKEKCDRRLMCGHSCTYSCGQWCPPCRNKCCLKCKHSECKKGCENSCDVCRKPCLWRCEHKQCSKCCGELCDREPCDKPCFKLRVCGHPCIGLCGEPCPPLCKICNAEELRALTPTKITVANALYVYLPDCKHTIEVEEMDCWMSKKNTKAEDTSIQMKYCPRCQSVVWDCPRYGNIIKSTFLDIQNAKKKLLDLKRMPRRKMIQLYNELETNTSICTHFEANFYQLLKKLEGKFNLSWDSMSVIENQIKILTRMAELKDKLGKIKVYKATKFLNTAFRFLVQRLFIKTERICEVELTHIIKEIDRTGLYVQMLQVEDQHMHSDTHPVGQQNLKKAKDILAAGNVLDDEEMKSIRAHLEAAATRKGIPDISDAEPIQIVLPVNFVEGHWYKCSNDHVYTIVQRDCERQASHCNECKVQDK